MDIDALPALYLDAFSAAAGERVNVRANGEGMGHCSLVRLRGLVGAPMPTAYDETQVVAPVTMPLTVRPVPMGSHAHTAQGPAVDRGRSWAWTFRCLPTLVDRGEIMAWGEAGPRLSLHDGELRLAWNAAMVTVPMIAGFWCEVVASWSSDRGLGLHARPIAAGAWHRAASVGHAAAPPDAITGALQFARGFNGKLEGPVLRVGDVVTARWDFATDMHTQQVSGAGPDARPLTLMNAPRRAVTSSAWTGDAHDWTMEPAHYGAIHFHEDDLADCDWPVDLALQVPADAPSGVYAVKLESALGVAYAPLVVRPTRPARVVFLASTFSYLAYTNSVWASPGGARAELAHPRDAGMARRYGLSTYSRHRDGSGIGLVSTRRPLLHATPGFLGEALGGQVAFNDDLRIISWLDRVALPYDVTTDHELHERGAAALEGYDVVVTGAHPEYHSAESFGAVEAFVQRGGRLMYLGGNGFYWRVSTLGDAPHVMELRRAEGGVRIWAEPPGEYHHPSDGKLGGLWRRIGRAPNRLLGVGFSAQGSETETRPYVMTEAARDPRVAFLFEGVTATEIGRAGPLGAAAGYEVDRADVALGTPPHALVVARSMPFGPITEPVNEERLTHELVDADDPLRADMTFFEGPNGGAVFATSALLFGTALTEVDGAERVCANVLRRFLDPTAFALPPG